ncbi:MAG: exodeoxyribonuclease VII small subunit [Actinomycetota bacterium]
MSDAELATDGLSDGDAADSLGYAAALSELDAILDELESSTVDVDTLAARVARGAELVRYCRNRLEVVRAEVDAVVTELLAVTDDEGTA